MAQNSSNRTWSNSEAYEAIMGRWSRPAAEAALAWLDLPAGSKWLDVGCGTGTVTAAILATEAPAEILGVDPSTDFLALARKQIHDERVTFSVGNASELPTPNDHFDVVISGLILHFVPDAMGALRDMLRAVRPGGTVAGHVWALTSPDQFTRPFWRAALGLDPSAAAWDLNRTHALNDQERFGSVFAAVGLKHVSVSELSFPAYFENFDDYWLPCLLDGATPLQRYTNALPADRKMALRERVHAELPIAADGSISLFGRMWIARGQKAG